MLYDSSAEPTPPHVAKIEIQQYTNISFSYIDESNIICTNKRLEKASTRKYFRQNFVAKFGHKIRQQITFMIIDARHMYVFNLWLLLIIKLYFYF